MLLKNVLSPKGAKLSLKTVSFKGQIDEIIGEYAQFWPVLDLVCDRDIPEEPEEEDEEAGKDGEGTEKGDAEKKDGGEKGMGKRKNSAGDLLEGGEGKKNGGTDQANGKDNKGFGEDGKKNGGGGGDTTTGSENTTEEEDENLVDLFIDLSVADHACWSIYGSDNSLPQNSMMPGYFDPDVVIQDEVRAAAAAQVSKVS